MWCTVNCWRCKNICCWLAQFNMKIIAAIDVAVLHHHFSLVSSLLLSLFFSSFCRISIAHDGYFFFLAFRLSLFFPLLSLCSLQMNFRKIGVNDSVEWTIARAMHFHHFNLCKWKHCIFCHSISFIYFLKILFLCCFSLFGRFDQQKYICVG